MLHLLVKCRALEKVALYMKRQNTEKSMLLITIKQLWNCFLVIYLGTLHLEQPPNN